MQTISRRLTKEEKHAHDEIAAALSIVPGLGHIYKGHYEAGLLWMSLGMPFANLDRHYPEPGDRRAWPAVANPVLGGTRVDTYNERDRRHHHLTATWADDDESPD
jgi:hypothetical protein